MHGRLKNFLRLHGVAGHQKTKAVKLRQSLRAILLQGVECYVPRLRRQEVISLHASDSRSGEHRLAACAPQSHLSPSFSKRRATSSAFSRLLKAEIRK